MAEINNLRRSSRRKTQVNYLNTDTQLKTPSTTPQVRKSSRNKKKNSHSNDSDHEEISPCHLSMRELDEELENIEADVQKPRELFDENKDISGNRIYEFQTLAKKNAMIQKALQSRTPLVSSVKFSGLSEDKEKTGSPIKKINDTPATRSTRLRTATRSHNQSTAKKRSVKISSESESVSEDDEFIPSETDSDQYTEEDDEEEERSEDGSPLKSFRGYEVKKIQVPITPCRRGRSRNAVAYRDFV